MAMRDEDFAATLTLAEDDDGLWSPCMAAPVCEPPDWQSLCGQAEARAERARRKRCLWWRDAERHNHSRSRCPISCRRSVAREDGRARTRQRSAVNLDGS